jgi:hypothetical protein
MRSTSGCDFAGHVISEERRTVGRAHVRHIGQVLYRDRQARQPACFASSLASRAAFHDALGMLTGTIETQGRQRVYCRLDLGDAPGGSFDQLEGRDLALPQPRCGLDCGHPPEFIGH